MWVPEWSSKNVLCGVMAPRWDPDSLMGWAISLWTLMAWILILATFNMWAGLGLSDKTLARPEQTHPALKTIRQ